MNWYTTSILTIVLVSLANLLTRYFQNKIHPFYSLVTFVIGAALATSIFFFVLQSTASKSVQWTRDGALLAALAGIFWVAGQLFWLISVKNAPLSIVGPVIVGGIGVGAAITGIFFFKEALTITKSIGIVVVIVGAIILAKA